MDIFKLYRFFWDYCFENPEKIKPNHIAIYSFSIEHCNRLGWKRKFGFPTSMAMEATGIKSYSVYKKSLDDLVEFGFFEVIEYSKNQYSANIIALKENSKAHNKALDKAFTKHKHKQDESNSESIDSIDKLITIEPITTEPLTDHSKHQEIIEKFNSICLKLTNVAMLTDNRIEAIDLIEEKHGINTIDQVFMKINESDYLNGEGKDKWKANFDWILNPNNFIKILEDNYKNRNNGKQPATTRNRNRP